MVIPVILVIPSANTDHGEFPVVETNNNPSPNPKIAKPIQSKKGRSFWFKIKWFF